MDVFVRECGTVKTEEWQTSMKANIFFLLKRARTTKEKTIRAKC